jgi:hypothetical protein
MAGLNPQTIKVIKELKQKIDNLLLLESNIEVIWELEKILTKKELDSISNKIKENL